MEQLNYIKQINQFYKVLPNNPLSSNAQCLYFYLLNKDNELGWIKEFTVANLIICGFTSLSRQAFDRARNELVTKGYIKYRKGTSNQAGKYSIVCFVTQDNTQSDTQDNTQDDTQSGHTAGTLDKQNKTNNINLNLNNKGEPDFSVSTMAEFEEQIKGLPNSEQLELKSKYISMKHSWEKA